MELSHFVTRSHLLVLPLLVGCTFHSTNLTLFLHRFRQIQMQLKLHGTLSQLGSFAVHGTLSSNDCSFDLFGTLIEVDRMIQI